MYLAGDGYVNSINYSRFGVYGEWILSLVGVIPRSDSVPRSRRRSFLPDLQYSDPLLSSLFRLVYFSISVTVSFLTTLSNGYEKVLLYLDFDSKLTGDLAWASVNYWIWCSWIFLNLWTSSSLSYWLRFRKFCIFLAAATSFFERWDLSSLLWLWSLLFIMLLSWSLMVSVILLRKDTGGWLKITSILSRFLSKIICWNGISIWAPVLQT